MGSLLASCGDSSCADAACADADDGSYQNDGGTTRDGSGATRGGGGGSGRSGGSGGYTLVPVTNPQGQSGQSKTNSKAKAKTKKCGVPSCDVDHPSGEVVPAPTMGSAVKAPPSSTAPASADLATLLLNFNGKRVCLHVWLYACCTVVDDQVGRYHYLSTTRASLLHSLLPPLHTVHLTPYTVHRTR